MADLVVQAWHTVTELPEFPPQGDVATTTVEARGCPNPNPVCREHQPGGDVGRAAGAHLTGQRQDGPSHVPVREQYPRAVHGGSGLLAPSPQDRAA